jgi:hypothetical protein
MQGFKNHKERERYLDKARLADSFQDAVFHIQDYNLQRNGQPTPAVPHITPEEVFISFNPEIYSATARDAETLLRRSHADVAADGEARALDRMRVEHPGYSEKIYGRVAILGSLAS